MAAYSKPFVRTQNLKIDGVEVTATAAELNAAATGALTPMVTLTGDTTLVAATHAGKTLLLGEVGGNAALAATLPAATGSGAKYRFVVSVVNTSGYTIQVTTTDIMQGSILSTNDSGTGIGWLAGATADTIILDGTTKGGVSIGDFIECEDILDATWMVSGVTNSSGAEATPFSAAVGA